jgi:transcriptional regulator with XRE-family HTH domain
MDERVNRKPPDVGGRVRFFREQRGLSLRKLSDLSGVSINAISLIERGENSPTVASLHALAKALSVGITDLFRAAEETRAVFVPRHKRLAATVGTITMASLGHGLRLQQLEPFVATIEPGGSPNGTGNLVHPGQEFLYCLDGELECRVGPRTYTLKKGDSLLFEATEPHNFRNSGHETAELLVIFQAPEGAQIARERHLGSSV